MSAFDLTDNLIWIELSVVPCVLSCRVCSIVFREVCLGVTLLISFLRVKSVNHTRCIVANTNAVAERSAPLDT